MPVLRRDAVRTAPRDTRPANAGARRSSLTLDCSPEAADRGAPREPSPTQGVSSLAARITALLKQHGTEGCPCTVQQLLAAVQGTQFEKFGAWFQSSQIWAGNSLVGQYELENALHTYLQLRWRASHQDKPGDASSPSSPPPADAAPAPPAPGASLQAVVQLKDPFAKPKRQREVAPKQAAAAPTPQPSEGGSTPPSYTCGGVSPRTELRQELDTLGIPSAQVHAPEPSASS